MNRDDWINLRWKNKYVNYIIRHRHFEKHIAERCYANIDWEDIDIEDDPESIAEKRINNEHRRVVQRKTERVRKRS